MKIDLHCVSIRDISRNHTRNYIYNQCKDSIDLFTHKGQQNEI